MLRQLRVRFFAWIVVVTLPASALPAQVPEPGHYQIGPALTIQTPPDVNRPPLCTEMSLHCSGSGKEFPDFGLAITAARYWKWPVGLAAEAGLWGNQWRSGPSADGQETNLVTYFVVGPAVRSPLITYGGSNPQFFRLHLEALVGMLNSTLGGTAAVQHVGAGLTGRANPNVWVRFQFDYRFSKDTPRKIDGGRSIIAVVFTW